MSADTAIAGAACLATNYSPWVGLKLKVPAAYLQEALRNPDAVQAALQLGRLDLLTGFIACVGLILSIAGVVGFGFVYLRAHAIARQEARSAATLFIPEFFGGDGGSGALKRALLDPGVVATIQAAIVEIGIGNTPEAAIVDTDTEKRETGHDGQPSCNLA